MERTPTRRMAWLLVIRAILALDDDIIRSPRGTKKPKAWGQRITSEILEGESHLMPPSLSSSAPSHHYSSLC
ncbi:hypothetical protein QBC37DRAFT_417826 [Rhypophila decipiens]|uniref:Secreted protein n=1 Tax=Rhypophila decipiens TaxID=261697 RepID=A0AAN6YBA8_9PEZI|nr:hypothetical protein QBC37DRAFT_417826 [Rhypophila decipiens]